jgi:hypothetical protein
VVFPYHRSEEGIDRLVSTGQIGITTNRLVINEFKSLVQGREHGLWKHVSNEIEYLASIEMYSNSATITLSPQTQTP